MQLSRADFDTRIAEKKLILTFIGMSGIGKTRHARRLALLGLKHISCDDLIAPRIASITALKNVTDVGLWMGQPFSEGYKDREQRFLELEELITSEALDGAVGNTVIDTTGSVIYLSSKVQSNLKLRSLVVYFEAAPEMYERMLTVYLNDPKPVVWGESFQRDESEDEEAALRRSYPRLLEFRAKRYQELSDITLPYKARAQSVRDAERLLRDIREELAA